MKILITNDDGYTSPGLHLLYEIATRFGEVLVFSTEYPRSAVGHTITFMRPLRMYKARYMDIELYVTDGTPVDAIHLAIEVVGFKPDLVLSGINVGENLTLQHIFYSGTVAAAIEAALIGIPAVAISANVTSFRDFYDTRLREIATTFIGRLLRAIAERGFPEHVDVLSINIPNPYRYKECVKVVRAARLRWKAGFEERKDPRGQPYYWMCCRYLEPEPDTDVYAVEVEGCIAVTPIRLDLANVDDKTIELVKRFIEYREV